MTFAFLALLAALPTVAPTQPPPAVAPSLPAQQAPVGAGPFNIDPKNRVTDIIQAYELLKKDKPTQKIFLRTKDNIMLANITDITAASKGTLLFVKVLSNQGGKYSIVAVEDVEEIGYSP